MRQPALSNQFQTDKHRINVLNFGYTRSAYWLRLSLVNHADQPVRRMLDLGFNRLSYVTFFQPDLNEKDYTSITTGCATPFSTRPYENRVFVFPLTVPAHSAQTYFLRIQSDNPIIIPAVLWSHELFHVHERDDYFSQAWYFGLATAMVIFNLFLWIALRDVIYLLYVCSVSALAISIGTMSGFTHEFLWSNSTWWSDISGSVGFALSYFFLLLFMRQMLNTRTTMPKTDRLILMMAGINLLFPLGFALSLQTFSIIYIPVSMLNSTLILVVALYCTIKCQRSAMIFFAAYFVLLLASFMTVLWAVGIAATNDLTTNSLQIGSAIEMLLLAFALADRYNLIRQEKEAAQQEAFVVQQDLMEHLQSHERILEARVAARTDELSVLNRKLEQLSTTDALTDIANRRQFDLVFDKEWHLGISAGLPLALTLLDIDWFKKYNDHYGHQAGDEVLRQVATLFCSNINRSRDLVARYGGEEFVFIAPATDADSALKMARNICESLQSLGLPHAPSAFGVVTISVGVAVMVPQPHDSPSTLLKAADEALYRAKKCGRNQAVLA